MVKIFLIAAAYLLMASCSWAEEVEKSLMLEVATNNKRLGHAVLCAADVFDDAETRDKIIAVMNGGIGFLRQYKGKELTDEGAINIANVVISGAVKNFQGVHGKCATAGDSYTANNTPASGALVNKTGHIFIGIGKAMDCLIQKGQVEKIPDFYRRIIQGLGSDENPSLVDVLYKHETILLNDLSSVSAECKA
ncbi:uncharacterized protein LOC142230329 [Haematobia irritans]|uniref:uncharacterized protein LOC142230329 n=1 Tax=Haematobia irritans TaxID=7368 RepID=UPI003F500C87